MNDQEARDNLQPQIDLVFASGARDGEGMSLRLTGDAADHITIGRLAECEIALPSDPDVSRRHAKLTWKGGGWWLEDLGSANGTFVGEFSREQRLAEAHRVLHDEIFRVGSTRMLVRGYGRVGAMEAVAGDEADAPAGQQQNAH